MSRQPTDEQRNVIEATSDKFVVSASAGAGKTFVLVERYLWLIENLGLEPNQILTITFTKKAAAEMKRRIVDRLRDLGYPDRAQVAETGPIQTIHSFCDRLLRENSLDAGIDPDFEIVSESKRAQLQDQAIASALTQVPKEHPEAELLVRTLAGQTDHTSSSPYAVIERSIRTVVSGYRGTQYQLSDLQALCDIESLRRSLEAGLLADMPEEVLEGARFMRDGSLAERMLAAHKSLKRRVLKFLRGNETPESEELMLRHTVGLAQLACHAWSHLEFALLQNQEFDYSLLEAKAVELLNSSEATRQRLREQYAAVMVDEAQDVNPVQHSLIDSLNVDRLMIVGDVKQSIYGFRLADVKIFRDRELELMKLGLSKNWRSKPGILSFVDELFDSMWPGEYTRMGDEPEFDPNVVQLPSYEGVEIWEMPDKDVSQTAQFILEMQQESGLAMKDITVLVRFRKFAMDLVQRLDRLGIKARIVGGTDKFYVRLEIRDLANVLKALVDPYDDFALLSAMRSPLAGISLDLIGRLAMRKPVIEAMKGDVPGSPEELAALDKFKEWFLPLSAKADKLSAWEVLAEILASSDYLAALARLPGSERTIANVRKLFMIATKEPELGPAEFAEQIREIQRLAHKEGDAPSEDDEENILTIMTIHNAKGLEFEGVVLPDVHWPTGGKTEPVEVDARLGLLTTNLGGSDSVFHRWLQYRRQSREHEEEMRVLYVAMTRAKSRLCVVAHPTPRRPDSIAAIVGRSMRLGKSEPLGIVRRTMGTARAD